MGWKLLRILAQQALFAPVRRELMQVPAQVLPWTTLIRALPLRSRLP